MAKAKIFKGVPYTGTLPATLTGTKAGYLHRYKIFGNMEQTGTPTPENPIEPAECGERTENLFDKDSTNIVGGYLNSTGAIVDSGGYYRTSDYMKILNSNSYVIHLLGRYTSSRRILVAFYDESKTFLSFAQSATFRNVEMSYAPEIPQNAVYIRFSYIGQNTLNTDVDIMLTEGSTAPTSYIPYGYKLPLQSGSTPVDLYLGESQTTRRIKKLVLTGKEEWTNQFAINLFGIANFLNAHPFIPTVMSYSSHYVYNPVQTGIDAGSKNGDFMLQRGTVGYNLFFKDTNFATVTAWKEYLAAQYATGTPVTVWYVLETAETGTLNEPLRKIGDYADTIDSTQTSAQIPTSAGSTTIGWAGEGLAPSQFDSIAEWINATPKIYRSGAWVDAQTYTYTNGAWVADN